MGQGSGVLEEGLNFARAGFAIDVLSCQLSDCSVSGGLTEILTHYAQGSRKPLRSQDPFLHTEL